MVRSARFPVALLVLSLTTIASANDTRQPVSFVNDIVPVLTKAGCNAGSCHAKAGGGQRGFQLSVLGFDPPEDYERLVKEGHGRRLFPGDPGRSLLLQKATGVVPHGGGVRLTEGSEGYQLLQGWIAQGAPFSTGSEPELVSIGVKPDRAVVAMNAEQQLQAIATYSDGSTLGVTEFTLFESNDAGMAHVSESGLVEVLDVPGRVAVMVRFQAKGSVFTASVPLGATVENVPPRTTSSMTTCLRISS